MSKSTNPRHEKHQIKRYLFSNTIMNIDSIARQINEGYFADKEMMIKLINRMLAFINEFVKPKETTNDDITAKDGVSSDSASIRGSADT